MAAIVVFFFLNTSIYTISDFVNLIHACHDTISFDKVSSVWLVVFSTNNTDHHVIADILFNVIII